MPATSSSSRGWYPARVLTLAEVRDLFRRAACRRVYVKELAPNDDSKRQIYLGSDLTPFNILPCRVQPDPPMPTGIRPTRKRKRPRAGVHRIFGHLEFYWLGANATRERAPDAKLVYYPQYPEVRLSGFLRGVRSVPSRFLREKAGQAYRNRLLFLGIAGTEICGLLIVGHDDLRDELRSLPGYDRSASLNTVPLDPAAANPKDRLLEALGRVHRKGWIPGKRLRRGTEVPCNAPNAVGYTLEAELGIMPNGDNKPDFERWEVKACTVKDLDLAALPGKRITVMTPEPNLGIYCDRGVEEFLKRWGYADRKGRADRRNFGGVHRAGAVNPDTGLRLEMRGFDRRAPGRLDPSGILALVSPGRILAAGWAFRKLLDVWRRKHAMAVYVPAQARCANGRRQYRYGPTVMLCTGTDLAHLLEAIADGIIYVDPALKAEGWSTGQPRIKRRWQFRVRMEQLTRLYARSEFARV